MQQAAFGSVSWEYSDSAFNIGGRTNLMYSIFWGVLGLVWVKAPFCFMVWNVETVTLMSASFAILPPETLFPVQRYPSLARIIAAAGGGTRGNNERFDQICRCRHGCRLWSEASSAWVRVGERRGTDGR